MLRIPRYPGQPPTYAVCYDPKTFPFPKPVLALQRRVEERLAGKLKAAGKDPALARGGFARVGLGGSANTPAAAPISPAVLPEASEAADPDDRAIKTAKRRKSSRRSTRSGRLSTINTAPLDTVLG